MNVRQASFALGCVVAAACGGGPASPEPAGIASVHVTCAIDGQSPLVCSAKVSCVFHACAPGTPSDVTNEAVWEIADQLVVRMMSPGRFEAVAIGDTFVTARWKDAAPVRRTMSVFAGTAPLPTYEIGGNVFEAGKTSATGPMSGALVEIIAGFLAGRTATAGTPPTLLPGFVASSGSARYRFLGVPAGAYRLRATKPGFQPEERDVTITVGSTSVADIAMSVAPNPAR